MKPNGTLPRSGDALPPIGAPDHAQGSAPSGGRRSFPGFTLVRRLEALTLASRVGLGFGVVLALVLLLALIAAVSLYGVGRGVGAFSAYADASQAAAELDIGLRDLEVSVRDHLAEGDQQSLLDAGLRRDGMLERLTALAGMARGEADRRSVEEARKALDAYWSGFESLVALRGERARLTESVLEPRISQIRAGLGRLKDAGGVDSAALAGDATVAILMMQDHLGRYMTRRDDRDSLRMRAELENARAKLAEMNRYLWVPGTRQTIDEVEAALAGIDGVLDGIETSLTDEDGLRAERLAPNAAAVAAHAAEIRQRNDAIAADLRSGLADQSWRTLRVALWAALGVTLAGLAMVWFVNRRVSRPVSGMAAAVTSLAAGRTDIALPPDEGADEVSAMARAVRVLRDNTAEMERQRQEAAERHGQLLRDKERADAANEAKTHFLVNIGQELHAPLNEIVASSQSMMSELHRLGAGELATDIEQIQWTGEQMLTLVDAILDYARIEAGNMDVVLQDFDVHRLLIEVRERTLPAADLNGNEVALQAEAATLGQMHSDFGKVRQALLNLLDNACKFTQGGGVVLAAERVEREEEPWLRFTVTDSGSGFATGQTARLFQPFVQGGTGGKRRGAGLGLTLVGHYAAMLGGDIEVASEPGQGTRITVALPAYYRPPAEERPLQVGTAGAAKRPLVTIGTLRPVAQLAS